MLKWDWFLRASVNCVKMEFYLYVGYVRTKFGSMYVCYSVKLILNNSLPCYAYQPIGIITNNAIGKCLSLAGFHLGSVPMERAIYNLKFRPKVDINIKDFYSLWGKFKRFEAQPIVLKCAEPRLLTSLLGGGDVMSKSYGDF